MNVRSPVASVSTIGHPGPMVLPLARPAGRFARLAAFRSAETDRLGRAIGFPIAVLRIVDDPAREAVMLSETWHACWRPSENGWFMPFDYDDASSRTTRFAQVPLDERWMGRTALPAAANFEFGCLVVELPSGVSRSDVAQAFGQAMADQRFDCVAQRPSKVRHRFASGRPLQVPARYAASPAAGCDGRVKLVRDLYLFHPRSLPSVVDAIESSVRILVMCSALAEAAATADGGHD